MNENINIALAAALYMTANSIAREMVKNMTVRSEMASVTDLINLQTEMNIDALTIVMLKDHEADAYWKRYFENQDLMETLTY